MALERCKWYTDGMDKNLGKSNLQIIGSKAEYGIYCWKLPDGRLLGNEEGDPLVIDAYRNEKPRIEMLREAAKGYGYPDGEPIFFPGKKPLTREQWELEQELIEQGIDPTGII